MFFSLLLFDVFHMDDPVKQFYYFGPPKTIKNTSNYVLNFTFMVVVTAFDMVALFKVQNWPWSVMALKKGT